MIKAAIRSIKDDFSRAMFFWLTFVLTSMFMFLFFHVSYGQGVCFIDAKNDISTFVTILVITICMIVIYFANDFYVKKKSKDLAVYLVCGGTFIQIALFLLIQTICLFLLAIPFGIALAVTFFPVVNYVLDVYLQSDIVISIQTSAATSTLIIIFVVLVWCTILNLGYAFRSSIKSLIDDEKTIDKQLLGFPVEFQINVKKLLNLKKIIAAIMFIGPLFLMYFNRHDFKSMMLFSMIGMIGFYLCIGCYVIPCLDYLVKERIVHKPVQLITYGFVRNDILLMKKNIVLLVVSTVLLLAILLSCIDRPLEVLLSMLSFVLINILLSLSIMFRFSTELVTRIRVFKSIFYIGYTLKLQKVIMRKEIVIVYGFIISVCLLYMMNIFGLLYMTGLLNVSLIYSMLFAFLIPLLICGFINYVYYRYIILKGVK